MATREVQALTATIAPVDIPELLESEAAGDAVDVGDATLVRLPEVTGEADAVSAEDAVAVADAEVTSVAAGTSSHRPQFFATDVAIISLNLSELAVQKQLYDVVFPSSPHPATMSRTIELMGGSAHDGSESYPSAWLR
ncbi:uncharacterized protein N0V96_006310 [Colletotrichum fioriniae]|uniref:uncharacterized protein n=1 Tax=Colletotrichum fioriniae TaxID=710243 RepID=UPI0032D9B9C6|nr:hypothetical protein N0V96_006310 [Colletotrichum fioriniae]